VRTQTTTPEREYPRREIIKISRPNVFGSYFTVSFYAYGLQAPKSH